MKTTHSPFQFPFVIKEVQGYLTVSVPDFGISVAERLPPGYSINKHYVSLLNVLTIKAARKVLDQLNREASTGKVRRRAPRSVAKSLSFDDSDVLSLKQASEFLKIPTRTLRRWAREKKIKTRQTPGGHYRFIFSEINDFTNNERVLEDPC